MDMKRMRMARLVMFGAMALMLLLQCFGALAEADTRWADAADEIDKFLDTAFEDYLAEHQLDADAIDTLHPADENDERAVEKAFDSLYQLYPSKRFERSADWSVLRDTILRFANAHPDAFRFLC